jgi:hypothetical protein
MKPLAPALALAALAMAAAVPAAATDLTGSWRLSAKVETFAFMLNCRLVQTGERLGGVCTDVATNDPQHKPQGSHPLTEGSVDGDRVSFAYKSHFLLVPFTASYSGVLAGETITGEAIAPGHKGSFTAVRE